jgi:hypothetical protein
MVAGSSPAGGILIFHRSNVRGLGVRVMDLIAGLVGVIIGGALSWLTAHFQRQWNRQDTATTERRKLKSDNMSRVDSYLDAASDLVAALSSAVQSEEGISKGVPRQGFGLPPEPGWIVKQETEVQQLEARAQRFVMAYPPLKSAFNDFVQTRAKISMRLAQMGDYLSSGGAYATTREEAEAIVSRAALLNEFASAASALQVEMDKYVATDD